jgi:hypothetical protein
MKKFAVAAVAALAVAGVASPSASAGVPGPCERQQELFEKHNIQTDMDAPLVAEAYWTVCGVTG